MKKTISILLSVLLLTFIIPSSVAEQAGEMQMPVGIASNSIYCSDSFYITGFGQRSSSFTFSPTLMISSPSANKISVLAQAHTNITVDKIGFSSLHIQRWNGSNWINVASWYYKYKTSTSVFSFTGNANNAISGAYYRAVCTFYAEKNGETESVTVTTSYIKCK